jgi:heat shock protein HtpX
MRIWRSGETISVELDFSTDRPSFILRCRIDACTRTLSSLRRRHHRAVNHQHSAWAIAAMVLLLALCGWAADGTEGARDAVAKGTRQSEEAAISQAAMFRWFGARLLGPEEVPGLFRVLSEVCFRAQLRQLPELYYVAAPDSMNAYACGGPDHSAIVLTEGLLRRMSPSEVAGIVAHEVAHIRNQDGWSMNWALVIHRAIEGTALNGLRRLQAQSDWRPADRSLANVLRAAPALGRLLVLALSRIREMEADATALELIGDPQAMVTALTKLERHHTGAPIAAVAALEESPMRFLRSHPTTSERVGTLLGLAG